MIVVVAVKMTHKCDKDKCPSAHVKGPKMKCGKCGNVTYLQCFGFQAGKKIDGHDTVKMSLTNGVVFTTFIPCMAFHCCSGEMSDEEQKFVLKMPTVRSTSKSRTTKPSESESMIVGELNCIKEMLKSVMKVSDAHTEQIAEIKSLSLATESNVKKATEQSASLNMSSPALQYTQAFRNRALAKARNETPTSSKRKRTDSPSRAKMNLPSPKFGTKSNVNGLSVVPKRDPNRDDKPKFEKAIWVSRLRPDVTEEQVVEFITSNTSATDKTKMNVHKLVKKDADLTLLKFVSFKIELNVDDFNLLNDPAVWPENVMVREFMQVPKATLGEFFPRLKPAQKPTSAASMETQQI